MKTLLKLQAATVVILLMAAGALAQDLPKIAVYVTGEIGDNEKKMLGTRMLSTLVNSGRYRGIERSNAFLAEVEKEHIKQRSGDIDDSQISELGKQFGVKFVCIADITPGFGAYQVSARIIDVETAVVIFIGEAFSPLQTSNDLVLVSDNVVENMFSGKTSTAQQQQPTVVVIQQEVQPAPQTEEPKAPKVRKPSKYDWYFAPKYALPIGGMSPWGAINLESGLVWGKGTFIGIGIDGGTGHVESGGYSRGGILAGGSFNFGYIYNLPVENLQLVYGGSVGLWLGYKYYNDDIHEGASENTNLLAPFIKLRWKFVELSYRVLIGGEWYNDDLHYDKSDSRGFRFAYFHQIMLGVHFSTSKRVGK